MPAFLSNPSTYIYVAIAVVGLVLLGGLIYMIKQVQKGGASEERARQAENDLDIKKKQDEIILTEKDREDVARDMDEGKF